MSTVKTDEILVSEDLSLKVADLPAEIQALVGLFDQWREEHENIRTKQMQVAMAIEVLQARISDKVQQHISPKPADDITVSPEQDE